MFLYFGTSALLALPLEGEHRCATLERLRQSPPPLLSVSSMPNKNGKQERDAICNCPNEKFSTNFVVKWGSGVSESKAQEVLDLFEYAWTLEHEQLEYEPPIGQPCSLSRTTGPIQKKLSWAANWTTLTMSAKEM